MNIADMGALLATDPNVIWLLCLMGAIVVVGWTNFICGKGSNIKKYHETPEEKSECPLLKEAPVRAHTKEYKKHKRKKKITILLISIITTIFISPLVPAVVTAMYFFLGLIVALATIAYDVIYKGIGGLGEKLFQGVKV